MLKTIFAITIALLIPLTSAAQLAGPTTAREHFDEGLRLLRDASYEASLASFERSAALDATEPATFANIGAVSVILKRYERAEAAFRNAIRLAPSESSFHSELCRALSLQKKHAAAIAACEEGVRLAPTQEAAHSARIFAYQAAGRTPDFQRFLDLAIAQFRNSEVILILAVDFYIKQRNFEYAATLQESLVAMSPKVARHRGVLAEIYLNLERDAESLRAARHALRLEPNDPYANYAMGLIFFELGQHEEAIESFRKVRTDDPRLSYADYYRGMSELRRGRVHDAITVLRELDDRFPENLDFVQALATSLSQADRFQEAQTVYLKAKRMDPQSPEILGGLGTASMMRGEFAPAIENFEAALKLRPDNEMFRMFVNVSRGRQQIVARLPDMLSEVDENTKDIRKLLGVARTLAYANRFDEAEKYVDRIYALDPQDPNLYHLIGVTFSEMGRDDKAVIAYRKSVEKSPNAAAYFGLASHYREMGDLEQASAAFAKGIELKPDTPSFMKMYADMLQQHGKRREALEMYKRSLAITPTNPVVLFDAGVLSAKLGDKTGAQAYLGTLRSIDATWARKLERCLAVWL